MVESRAWDWKKNDQDFRNDPSEESYCLADRWLKKAIGIFSTSGAVWDVIRFFYGASHGKPF
jgi:hypothetical protein